MTSVSSCFCSREVLEILTREIVNEGCLGRCYFVMSIYPKGILCRERIFCSHDKSWHLILLDVKKKRSLPTFISLCYRIRDCLTQGLCCGESSGLKK